MEGVQAVHSYEEPVTGDVAIVALFESEYRRVVRLVFVLVGDSGLAEELAQEAFVRVWRRWRKLADPDSASTYLRRTALNMARSRLRRRILELRHRIGAREEGSEQDVAGRIDMVRALQRLAPRQRECLALRYYEDLSVEDSAHLLGVSPGTVKSQTHKALQRLEEILGEENDARA